MLSNPVAVSFSRDLQSELGDVSHDPLRVDQRRAPIIIILGESKNLDKQYFAIFFLHFLLGSQDFCPELINY